MQDFNVLKKRLLKNPTFKREYDALEEEYTLIEQVTRKRLEKRLTQKELATKIGTKQSAISRLESGNANPSFAFLQKIAHALGTGLRVSLQ